MAQKPLSLAGLFLALLWLQGCTNINSQPIFSDGDGALRGYDPVSYFELEQAVRGERDIHYDYAGASFYFSSQQNRQRFIDQPEKYLPQYGGYCAYGMSRNFVVSSDPDAFTLVDGKLYLNYSPKVRKTWLKDVPGHIAKANSNWADKLASGTKIEE